MKVPHINQPVDNTFRRRGHSGMHWPEKIAFMWGVFVVFWLALFSHLLTEPIECLSALLFTKGGIMVISLLVLPPYLFMCGIRWIVSDFRRFS
jgi:hypothetical protein